jgi:hypothetical protein
MHDRQVRPGFTLALVLSTLASLAVFKWQVIGASRKDDFLVGLLVEASFWGALWWLYEACRRTTFFWLRLTALGVFFPLFYCSAGLIFAYTFFFDSAVERRFSLLDIDVSSAGYFLTHVLPETGWAILIALIASSHVGALLLGRARLRVHLTHALMALTALVTLTAFEVHAATRVATPLYDIAHDFYELSATPRLAPSSSTRPYATVATLDRSATGPTHIATPFKKVLVFVMETMTAKKLEEESQELSADTFFLRERPRTHSFSRYFPNNQDSRTGMLDIVGSRLIPYEAYSEADLAAYGHVKHAPSLVDRFQKLGYRTAFAVSQSDLEPVITELPWDEIVRLTDADIERAKRAGALCFTPYEFEHSCEDSVLLPKVIDFITSQDKIFLFQEFIWGHAYEYNEASGRTNADYYSAYFDRVIRELDTRDLLDETLIVITSDHGFRDKGLQGQLDVYRIPLLLFSPGFSAGVDDRLLSHLDFKDILFDALAPGSASIADNEIVMIVGPTGTSLLAALTKQDDFLLVKTRADTRLLLVHENVGRTGAAHESPREPEAPLSILKLFDDYRRGFDQRAR